MKKNLMFAMFGAIALTGAVGLSSCTDEEVAEVNPGYNSETGEVPVSFVFNVSTGNTSTTRMSQADVQATSSDPFRGMENSHLMSYRLTGDGKYVTTPSGAHKQYGLGTIFGSTSIGPDSKTKSHRILELSLPVGTNTVMFWGKAARGTTNTDNTVGKIDFHVEQDIADNSFSLCPRVPSGTSTSEFNTTTWKNYQDIILAVLNNIVDTKITNKEITFGSESKTVTISWADYGRVNTGTTESPIYELKKKTTSMDKDPSDVTKPLCGLGEILSNAFYTLNYFKNSATSVDLRAGSGPAVEGLLSDLYKVINAVVGDDTSNPTIPTNIEEKIAQEVAKAVRANITKAMNNTGTDWQGIDGIKSELELSIAIPTGHSDYNDLKKFPSLFGMPEGSTVLLYDVNTNKYSYREKVPNYDMGGGATGEFEILRYMYPAELCYFGNSSVRVTDETKLASEYPEGTTAWDADASWSGWSSDAHVLSSTRSVAMKDNINYGTSLLKTTVGYKGTVLKDNNKAIQKAIDPNVNEDDQEIDLSETPAPFTLKGIVIGGQEQTVGWDYIANASTLKFDEMIYDNALSTNQQTIPTPTTDPIYTIVWDNWNENQKDNKQNIVFIALEFVNNSGIDFWGENNLIRKGATFYITGKLDPDAVSSAKLSELGKTEAQYVADKSLGITWPTNYALPPYDSDGHCVKQRRVFIQDFMTSAHFVLDESSLKHALIAVPDLRSAQLSLGLSVDLEWNNGLNYGEVVLGDLD